MHHDGEGTTVLGTITVCFDHEVGAKVESWHPPTLADENAHATWWDLLPTYALADGIHASDEDMVLFTLKEGDGDGDSSSTLYCCSYFHQATADEIINFNGSSDASPSSSATPPPSVSSRSQSNDEAQTSSDAPRSQLAANGAKSQGSSSSHSSHKKPSSEVKRSKRGREQRCLVIVSRTEQFTAMIDSLERFGALYFSRSRYRDERIPPKILAHMSKLLARSRQLRPYAECGMDLRWTIVTFGRRFFSIFKALLLDTTIACYGIPVKDACSASILLASLLDSVCRDVEPSVPSSNRVEVFPYLPVSEIDSLLHSHTKSTGFVFGTSNMLYIMHQHPLIDVTIDLVSAEVRAHPDAKSKSGAAIKNALRLSQADVAFVDFLIDEIQTKQRDASWIRQHLHDYVQTFVRSHSIISDAQSQSHSSASPDLASSDESHEETAAYLQDYNEEWSRSFTRTATFALLNEHFQSLDEQVKQTISASHPFGSLSAQDVVINNAKFAINRGLRTVQTLQDNLPAPIKSTGKAAFLFGSSVVRSGFGFAQSVVSSVSSALTNGADEDPSEDHRADTRHPDGSRRY